MNPRREENQERARKLAEQGATTLQIAELLGMKYNTAYYYTHLERERKKRRKRKESDAEPLEEVPREMIGKPGWNTDRHACRSCRYRAGGARKGCDYYMRTDLERGCDPADCDKYRRESRDGQENTCNSEFVFRNNRIRNGSRRNSV